MVGSAVIPVGRLVPVQLSRPQDSRGEVGVGGSIPGGGADLEGDAGIFSYL